MLDWNRHFAKVAILDTCASESATVQRGTRGVKALAATAVPRAFKIFTEILLVFSPTECTPDDCRRLLFLPQPAHMRIYVDALSPVEPTKKSDTEEIKAQKTKQTQVKAQVFTVFYSLHGLQTDLLAALLHYGKARNKSGNRCSRL